LYDTLKLQDVDGIFSWYSGTSWADGKDFCNSSYSSKAEGMEGDLPWQRAWKETLLSSHWMRVGTIVSHIPGAVELGPGGVTAPIGQVWVNPELCTVSYSYKVVGWEELP
jgi:hypothetical protein